MKAAFHNCIACGRTLSLDEDAEADCWAEYKTAFPEEHARKEETVRVCDPCYQLLVDVMKQHERN